MSNAIKPRMERGETVFGTWCMLPSSFVVDVIARTGVDFVVIDMEHGAMSLETAEDMVRAAQLQGCQPIIRVGDDRENTILHALETGCEAVMVPNVSTVGATQKIVQAARYAPATAFALYCQATHVLVEARNVTLKTLVSILVEGKRW